MEEKQMKTLGGYEIVDEKARKDIETISEKADEAYSLAKGATKAFVYDTYSDMIVELNALDKAELLVNFHVMIREVCVPDLWISGVSDEHVEYTYTSNEDFIVDLTEDGVVQVGHFVLSALETQKVDLSEYVKNTDYMSKDNYGVAKMADNSLFSTNGKIGVNRASENDIKAKANAYSLVPPTMIDLLVKVGMTTNSLEWTDEEKAKALELLGGLGKPTTGDGVLYFDAGLNMAVVKITDGTVASAYQIPRYAQGGVLPVGTPTMEEHAATKKYVDDLVGSVESILTELHAYAETKIGGEA